MNIEHLNKLTPERVAEIEGTLQYELEALSCEDMDLIIAALHAGLRLKKELSTMGERE
jgi:hypothetical protein